MATEIRICEKCKGTGFITCDELVNYHKRDYETWLETCKACNGHGRLIWDTVVTTTKMDDFIKNNKVGREYGKID